MNCKNCNQKIRKIDAFCSRCGAKIIKERISTKSLSVDFVSSLGWDSNLIKTIRLLIIKPDLVITEYIGGTRNKYTNPFALYALLTALTVFIFTIYSDEYFQLNTFEIDFTPASNIEYMLNFIRNYYSIITFILLPFYSFISYVVFRKPFNYWEHLIINTYIGCVTAFLGIILILISISSSNYYFNTLGSSILPFFYYCFTYKRLNNLSFGALLLKILKFIGALFILFLILIIATTFVVVIKGGVILK